MKRYHETIPMSELIATLNRLTMEQPTDVCQRLSVEDQKLEIIQAVENKLKQMRLLSFSSRAEQEKQMDDMHKSILKKIADYFLLMFGFFDNAATSYFFGSTLFAFIPGISAPVLMIASIAYTVLEGVLFYAFDVSLLNDFLSFSYTKTPLNRLIETYSQQLQATIMINTEVSSSLTLSAEDPELRADLLRFTCLLNKHLREKEWQVGTSKESAFKQAAKVGLVAFGAISSVAGSFFMITTFMAEAFVATPAGIILIVLAVIIGLVFHYAMGTTGMSRIVNPDDEKQEGLKKNWCLFFNTLRDPKQTSDASTQTEEDSVECLLAI